MYNNVLAPIFLALLTGSGSAVAADGKVVISAPHDGAVVSQQDKVELTYEAVPGTNGDHLHLNVDGKRIDVIRPMKGKAQVGMLPPGKHHICLAINTKAHVPTGTEGCIDITSK